MTDLDRLERLHRLRESGALSAEEYEQQKARLLTGADNQGAHVARRLWYLLPVVIALAALFLIVKQRDEESPSNVAASPSKTLDSKAGVAATAPMDAAPAAEPKEPVNNDFAWATSRDVIGVTPAYLEKRLGPAREKGKGYLSFDIGGCLAYYTVEGSEVTLLSASVTPKCHPNGVRYGATIGDILRKAPHGTLRADCIESCGNAADPDIELFYGGSRATAFIEEGFSTTAFAGAKGDPLRDWALAVRRARGLSEFEPTDDYEAFSCVSDPPPHVAKNVRRARVEGVRIGHQLNSGCAR